MSGKKFLEEFIEILKDEVSIWQMKSDKYKDRSERLKSWEKLLKKYKEVDKKATIDTVKKKYQSIRACYRRELRKIRESEKSGESFDDVYVPTLWYFENLDFLRDQETQLEEISTADEPFEEEIEKEPSEKKRKFDPSFFLQSAVNHLEKSSQREKKDEADIYGEAWAVAYRKLKSDQKIFAKHLMDDTLMYAQLGLLSLNSSLNLGAERVAPQEVHSALSPLPTHSTYAMPSNQSISSNQSGDIVSNEVSHSPTSFQMFFKSEDYQ